mgnify:CR=1 FL=1
MTVAELITKLQALPPEYPVVVWAHGWYGYGDYSEAERVKVVDYWYSGGDRKAVEVHW